MPDSIDDYLSTPRGKEALGYQLGEAMSKPPRVDPAERVVELLTKALPGFTSGYRAHSDSIVTLGTVKIGQQTGYEMLVPVADYPPAIEALAHKIVEDVQRFVIEAAGLEPVIADREAAARHAGNLQGYKVGKAEGLREGRAAGMRDVMRALLQSDLPIGDAVDEIRAAWEEEKP